MIRCLPDLRRMIDLNYKSIGLMSYFIALKRIVLDLAGVTFLIIKFLLFMLGILLLIGGIFGGESGPIAGDSCGEGNHWGIVGIGPLADLSCEEDGS